jgi:NADH-quinone oxidoreductase subunit C
MSESLKFHFTPADAPTDLDDANPHVQATTHLPEIAEAFVGQFDGAEIQPTYAGETTILIGKAYIVDAVRWLKETHGFAYLADLGGQDRFTEDDRYEVFYNLISIGAGKRLRLKLRVDEDDLTVPSITDVHRSADWHEREVWDMFGIRFSGHGDLRRMYMPEDFEYHPLRKEFPLLGIPGSLPLPAQVPGGDLNYDPFPAAHGSPTVKSFDEPRYEDPSAGTHD